MKIIVEFLQKHKRDIIIALVTGIGLYYFQPILDFIRNVFINMFIFFSKNFSDYYYQLVAKNYQFYIIDVLYNLVFMGTVITLLLLFLFNKKDEMEIEGNIKDIKNIINKNNYENHIQPKNEQELLDSFARIKRNHNSRKRGVSLYFLSYVILIIVFFFQYLVYSSANITIATLNNKIVVLSAYLSDKEVKQLKAQWVQIKSKADYDALDTKIDTQLKQFIIKK